MCGVTGFIDFRGNSTLKQLQDMVKTMSHRGPDDNGAEIIEIEQTKIGLGQARLSIIDLSPGGHQPMQYGELSIVYNGEIYNYKEIKSELESQGHNFVSDSDTEVILHAVKEWGHTAINRFIGMFVFVLYNSKTSTLSITRDRAGVKPIYYWFDEDLFLFGSELKPLLKHPRFKKEIDVSVLPTYFHHGYIPAPYSIFKNCYKLNPGHYLILDLKSKKIEVNRYWNPLKYYQKPKLDLSYQDAKTELHQLLKSAFEYRMVADVPVGVFLSGGYDSTAVAAVLQADRTDKLKTFTIGFEEGNNEAPYAKRTAEFLGTDHSTFTCTTREAQDIIPQLAYYYDEPFGDSSTIPTTLVSQYARQMVTVALSADGGDEVFCGYNAYFKLEKLNTTLNHFPELSKPFLRLFSGLAKYLPLPGNESTRHKVSSALEAFNKQEWSQIQLLFQRMSEKPQFYIESFFNKKVKPYPSPYSLNGEKFSHPFEVAMAIDYSNYLQNDILTKVDRATMSVSLEGREPLLDHRIFEFVAQLPISYKYNGDGYGKRILKDIVHDYLPKKMMDRPKTGFSLPIYAWLRSDLSFLLDEYLSKEALAWSGLFDVDFLSEQVKRFRQKKLHYVSIIWYLIMFQMWYNRFFR